ncbi:MAG: hypothetical protein WCA07_11240 [Gloeobacterales cyanobacterium]
MNGLDRVIIRTLGGLGLSFWLSFPVQAGNLMEPLPQKVLVSISGVQVVVTELPDNPRPNLVYFLPHQDERIAREAAYQLLPETGGKIVEIRQPEVVARKSGPCRNLLLGGTWLDPNQMFTSGGVVYSITKILTRHPNSPRPGDLFQFVSEAGTVSALALNALGIGSTNTVLVGTQRIPLTVIALHNNTPGSFNIQSYAPGGSYAEDAGAPPFSTPSMNPDDFVLVTRREDFEKLKALGVNTVFEDIQRDNGGLSLVAKQQGLQYFNVEVQHRYNRPDTCTNSPKRYSGHLDQQITLVRLILNQVAVNPQTMAMPAEVSNPAATQPLAPTTTSAEGSAPPTASSEQPPSFKPEQTPVSPIPAITEPTPIDAKQLSPSKTEEPSPVRTLPVSGKLYRPS